MQFLIVVCALLGVALGQYNAGYAGYPGYTGNAGYGGYPGYAGYGGYKGYPGYPGSAGYPGFAGYPGVPGAPVVKPVVPVKDEVKVVKPLPLPAPIVPIAPKDVYGGPYAAIRSQNQESYPDGSYNYQYQTDNGIYGTETGSPKPGVNGPQEVVQGSYSYTAPNGQVIEVRYTADENGFHPQGIHIGGQGASYNPYRDARTLPVVPAPVVAAAPKPEEAEESPKAESENKEE